MSYSRKTADAVWHTGIWLGKDIRADESIVQREGTVHKVRTKWPSRRARWIRASNFEPPPLNCRAFPEPPKIQNLKFKISNPKSVHTFWPILRFGFGILDRYVAILVRAPLARILDFGFWGYGGWILDLGSRIWDGAKLGTFLAPHKIRILGMPTRVSGFFFTGVTFMCPCNSSHPLVSFRCSSLANHNFPLGFARFVLWRLPCRFGALAKR